MPVQLEFYLWPSSRTNDHVALKIKDLDLYISWSPKYGKKRGNFIPNNLFDCESEPKETLEEDYKELCSPSCEDTCQKPEHTKRPKSIICLWIAFDKARKIQAWWEDYRARRENYRLHFNNCCHVVLRALTEAFEAFKCLRLDDYFLSPGHLHYFIQKLAERQGGQELRDGDIKVLKKEYDAKRLEEAQASVFCD